MLYLFWTPVTGKFFVGYTATSLCWDLFWRYHCHWHMAFYQEHWHWHMTFCQEHCNQAGKMALTYFFYMRNNIAIVRFELTIIVTVNSASTMGVWAETNLGGTKFLPEKFVTVITSPKKKKRSSPVSVHLFHHFRPKHVTKREAKLVMTFFFFGGHPFFCSTRFANPILGNDWK